MLGKQIGQNTTQHSGYLKNYFQKQNSGHIGLKTGKVPGCILDWSTAQPNPSHHCPVPSSFHQRQGSVPLNLQSFQDLRLFLPTIEASLKSLQCLLALSPVLVFYHALLAIKIETTEDQVMTPGPSNAPSRSQCF